MATPELEMESEREYQSVLKNLTYGGENIPETFLEVISGITSVLNSQKITVPVKKEVCDYIAQLVAFHEEILLENRALLAENRVLREHKKSSITYAAAVAASPKRTVSEKVEKAISMPRKNLLFLTHKEGGTSRDVQKIITQEIVPEAQRINIKQMRSTPKTVILETETFGDMELILSDEELRVHVNVERERRKKPLMIMYDVPTDLSDSELMNIIYEQNFPELISEKKFEQDMKIRFKTGPRNQSTVHVVMEMTLGMRDLIIKERKWRLYVRYGSHTLKDYIVVAKCLKCQDLGHVAKYCNAKSEVCAHCGELDHRKQECEKKNLLPTCIPCARRKSKCISKKECPTHKLMWDRLVARIYSEYQE